MLTSPKITKLFIDDIIKSVKLSLSSMGLVYSLSTKKPLNLFFKRENLKKRKGSTLFLLLFLSFLFFSQTKKKTKNQQRATRA
jgi:hypothetical protein